MDVKTLKDHLSNIPDDYQLALSKLFIIHGDEDEEHYDCVLDMPMCGVASSEEDREVRFILHAEDMDRYGHLGEITRMTEER